MAVDAYLKVAADQVEQAMVALRQEASQLRSDADNRQRHMETDFTRLKADIQADRALLLDPDENPARINVLQAQIRRHESEKADKERRLHQELQQMHQTAQAKESAASDLQGLVSSLHRVAGDSRMR